MVERIDIERALDKLAADEAGFRFQSLAVVLAKLRWTDLIASERHKDRGLDAYVSAADSSDGRGKGLACSTTGTLKKIKDDADETRKHYPDVTVLIFYTTGKVTQETKAKWAEAIREEFGYELVVASREEIISALHVPDNVQLCRTHLDLAVPYQPALSDLLAEVHEAAAIATSEWASHPRLLGKPHITLDATAVDQNGSDSGKISSIVNLRPMLAHGRRIILEAPAGRGKTTTLIQLATINESVGGIPIFVDLPNWVRSGKPILDYVASSPAFQARRIDAENLARVPLEEPFLFLLNGWNEIAELYSVAAIDSLRQLERSFPTSGIMVATRTHHIVPPLPGAARYRLMPLTPRQRFEYMAQALGESRAQALHVSLSSDRALDNLTRTPFFLSEVSALLAAGHAMPRTKMGLMRDVIRLIEESDEHAGALQSAPLRGLATFYLCAIAHSLSSQGTTSLVESDARAICWQVSHTLQAAGQFSAIPESADILAALAGHHVIERNEYPASFRFEHQQFQEFYAAQIVKDELEQLVATGEARDIFIRRYINDPSWDESLHMLASDLGDRNDVNASALLVELTLHVDAVFAARLAFEGGPALWKRIGSTMHTRLRALYASSSAQLREYALTAMLATGSEEFTDILIPLLTDSDTQVRLGAYRRAAPFRTSSLGNDWWGLVSRWPDERRAEFASELTIHHRQLDVGLAFARSDPAFAVRLPALRGLIWMGQDEAVVQIIQSLTEPEFEAAIFGLHIEELPEAFHLQATAAYRSRLKATVDPKTRLQLALALAELRDPETPERLKAELSALPLAVVRDVSDHALRPAAEILSKSVSGGPEEFSRIRFSRSRAT